MTFAFDTCKSCGKPFVDHGGIMVTCAKLQKSLDLLRELHDFGNPTDHYVHHERAKKAFKDAASLLRELEPKASDEATESKEGNPNSSKASDEEAETK